MQVSDIEVNPLPYDARMRFARMAPYAIMAVLFATVDVLFLGMLGGADPVLSAPLVLFLTLWTAFAVKAVASKVAPDVSAILFYRERIRCGGIVVAKICGHRKAARAKPYDPFRGIETVSEPVCRFMGADGKVREFQLGIGLRDVSGYPVGSTILAVRGMYGYEPASRPCDVPIPDEERIMSCGSPEAVRQAAPLM